MTSNRGGDGGRRRRLVPVPDCGWSGVWHSSRSLRRQSRSRVQAEAPFRGAGFGGSAALRRWRHGGVTVTGRERNEVHERRLAVAGMGARQSLRGRNGRGRTGLGRDAIFPPYNRARGDDLLRGSLGRSRVGAAVAAPGAARHAVLAQGAANPARAHRTTAKETHAHAVLGSESALAASSVIRGIARTDVWAHLHDLRARPPILGVGRAAIEAEARLGAHWNVCHKFAITTTHEHLERCAPLLRQRTHSSAAPKMSCKSLKSPKKSETRIDAVRLFRLLVQIFGHMSHKSLKSLKKEWEPAPSLS